MNAIVSLTDISKSYPLPEPTEASGGRLDVLDIDRFEIAKGEQVALIGQSGGGKTTLLHLIAGLITPDSGHVSIDGYNVSRLSEAGRDRFRASSIGYIFQTFNLLPAFTALENVKLGQSFGRHNATSRRPMELLERVGLGERANYRPSQLSVGQQQRVAIARALAGTPKLLLADEPTANVDPVSGQAVLDLIRTTCREENVALLLVTHDHDIAKQFDRVVRLDEINRAFKAAVNQVNAPEQAS